MTDLNSASLTDLTAAGVEAALAVQLALWRPYRCWSDLDRIIELQTVEIERLRERGFTLQPLGDESWAIPAAFQLSARAS
jgi:hypothetical protein